MDRSATALWSAGAWTTTIPGRPAVERWSSGGGQRILVVAPHPDDEVAGCGGTIALHRRAGDEVTVVHVTDGRRSRAIGLEPDAMAAWRRREARAGLAALGVAQWDWLGLPEGQWVEADGVRVLGPVLGIRRPHVIYAPSRVDFHPEHARVARVLAAALVAGPGSPTVRVYQVQVPLTRVLVNRVAAVGSVMAPLTEAFEAHGSQEGAWRSGRRLRRYAARVHGLPPAVEEFWEMSAAGFRALHSGPPPQPASLIRLFRGLRRSPLTDPLAFAIGRAERRRLAALVESAG